MLVEKAFKKFLIDVTTEAKQNLKNKGKNASKSLSNSIDYDLKVHKNSYSASISMEDYGDFIDKGVKGVGGSKADGSKWKVKKVTNNSFKYKNKKPPAKAFDKWIVRRGIANRDAGGRFTSRRSTSFAIANSVYHTGLETTNFISNPIEKHFKTLPDEVVEAYALTIDNIFTE